MTKLQTLEKITQQIATQFKPASIILFGSQAWGSPHADSDIDLCVITHETNTRDIAQRIDNALFPRSFPIDVMVYSFDYVNKRHSIGDPFVTKILTEGKVLYEQ